MQIWKGYIASERELVCTKCSALIPNCLSCSSSDKCDLCQRGFRNTKVFDDTGTLRTVCLKDFCGIDGVGLTCQPVTKKNSSLKNCKRIIFVSFSEEISLEHCEQCDPGYYLEYYAFNFPTTPSPTPEPTPEEEEEENNITVFYFGRCMKPAGNITKNFFVRPELVNFFIGKHEEKLKR